MGIQLPILFWNRTLTNDDFSNNISAVRIPHILLLKLYGTGDLRMNSQDVFNAKKQVSTKDT